VEDGTYHLVELTIYSGPGGASGPVPIAVKQTVAIHGTTAEAVTEVSGKSQAQSTTFVTAGTAVTTAGTCPTMEPPQTGSYTATASALVLYLINGDGKTVRYKYVP
jgi:hypothetical protein